MRLDIRSVIEYPTLQRNANYPEKVLVQSKKKYQEINYTGKIPSFDMQYYIYNSLCASKVV